MKMIYAVIRPERLSDVKIALEKEGYIAMSITEIMGRGEQKGIRLQYRGSAINVDLIPKVKIEMVVDDEQVDPVITIIKAAARTGKVGDGKIFVLPVERACKVRIDD